MARYKTKTENDLRLNAIRRMATARVDLEVKSYRERRLNEVLTELQQRFDEATNEGEIVEVNPDYGKWMNDTFEAKALSK